MQTIENIIVFDGFKEVHNPDIANYDRAKNILNQITLFLKSRGTNVIKKINKEKAIIYINRRTGEWKLKNASKTLINRVFS